MIKIIITQIWRSLFMKRNTLCLSVLAAAFTLTAGFTAFAGQWEQDSNGWYYVQDNGTLIYGRAFTDPADGSEYFMDPDGYMMTETRVNGFWYGSDGRRQEKTEAEIAAEAAREQRLASRPSPSKEQAAAKQAAQAAKTSKIAAGTTRLAYQAEMKALMDAIFIDTRSKVKNNTAIKGSTTEDNIEVIYRFNVDGRGTALSCSLWKMSNPENSRYKPEALELSYNRDIVSDASEVSVFNNAFSRLLTAALGENKSKAVYDRCLAEEIGGGGSFEETGVSDTGNSYELTYRNNMATIKITCSEIDLNAAAEEKATLETAAAEEAAPETAAEQQPTTSVIVAGQGALAAASEAGDSAASETVDNNSEADGSNETEAGTSSETEAAA